MIVKSSIQHPREHEEKIFTGEILKVLNRANNDKVFWKDLIYKGSEALKKYNLDADEKAAIVSGDINWIEDHIGKLLENQKKILNSRLQMESW